MALKNPFRKARKFTNPVRYQYVLVGTSLVLAGIRPDPASGNVAILKEVTDVPLAINDPAERLWITKSRVTSAAARAGVPVDLTEVPLAVVEKELKKDSQALFRPTRDHIVHMFPLDEREDKDVLAFVDAQIEALEQSYAVAEAAA